MGEGRGGGAGRRRRQRGGGGGGRIAFHTRLPRSLRSPSTQPPSLARSRRWGLGSPRSRSRACSSLGLSRSLGGARVPSPAAVLRATRGRRIPGARRGLRMDSRVQSAAHFDAARKHARSGAYLERCFACRERVLEWDPEQRAWGDALRTRLERALVQTRSCN